MRNPLLADISPLKTFCPNWRILLFMTSFGSFQASGGPTERNPEYRKQQFGKSGRFCQPSHALTGQRLHFELEFEGVGLRLLRLVAMRLLGGGKRLGLHCFLFGLGIAFEGCFLAEGTCTTRKFLYNELLDMHLAASLAHDHRSWYLSFPVCCSAALYLSIYLSIY